MKPSSQIIVIAGPTASGKTKLAIDFAKKLDGEIICADSRSIYKDFDIVSAKPTFEEQSGIPHHLLDIILPHESFSAGEFSERAKRAIEEIESRNKQVIICGGTWFYISALFGNISSVPPNPKLRATLEDKSSLVLFDMLLDLNEKRAREIEPNNRERVIRAIEVAQAGGSTVCSTMDAKIYAPKIERKELYSRIDKRVDLMVEMGLEDEYRRNKEKYGNLPATIGYDEFETENSIEKIKQHTRNFAKRQLTWLRSREDIIYV